MIDDITQEALAALDERYDRVCESLREACAREGRDPNSVALVAASKTVSQDVLKHLIGRGHAIFGENKVQEGIEKWPQIRLSQDCTDLRLIGPLQTNKARDAVRYFDVIESVDREKLCSALAREQQKQGRKVGVYIQVNVGGEPQKSGCQIADADSLIERASEHHGLDVSGVMGIPPSGVDPRPYFQMLTSIATRHSLPNISMGMSRDFEAAIAEGSTHIRVGTAIFGQRPSPVAGTATEKVGTIG